MYELTCGLVGSPQPECRSRVPKSCHGSRYHPAHHNIRRSSHNGPVSRYYFGPGPEISQRYDFSAVERQLPEEKLTEIITDLKPLDIHDENGDENESDRPATRNYDEQKPQSLIGNVFDFLKEKAEYIVEILTKAFQKISALILPPTQ
uniref:Uncharacterized protein n=1 Tax=Timema cristinae TaxID=61476 RepID=A0A7R9GYM3_TIMCR|nr:unnamed protein product [Timema cristinae]